MNDGSFILEADLTLFLCMCTNGIFETPGKFIPIEE